MRFPTISMAPRRHRVGAVARTCTALLTGHVRRLASVALAALAVVAIAAPLAAGSTHEHYPLVFRPPVDAPVSDPFRPPDGPYGAGNRGIEYDTRPGEVVRAAAGGTVSFAGPVAGELYVTLDHGGGVLSTYSYLERISVRVGADVMQGEVVGISGEILHFSVRVDGAYVDPDAFIGVRRVRVRLVPLRGRTARR